MLRCARHLLPLRAVLLLITAWTLEVWLTIWIRWLTLSLTRHGKDLIGSWLACCAMSPSGLKQAVADLVRFTAAEAVAQQTTGADEHQAVNQALSAGAGHGAVY